MNTLFHPPLDIDYLYQLADKDNDGYIGTTDALEFFQYTHLKRSDLSSIWSLCVPSKQPMNKEQFILSLRCIYYVQQGEQLSMESFQQKQSPFHAPSLDCPFLLSDSQLSQLEQSFKRITQHKSLTITKNQLIDEIQYLQNNHQKKLENINVDMIMKLSDIDKDNQLNYYEFIIAVSCINYYHSFHSLPSSLPSIFLSSLKHRLNKPTPIKRTSTTQIPLLQQIKINSLSMSKSQPLKLPTQTTQISLTPRSQRSNGLSLITVISSSTKSSSKPSTPRQSNGLSYSLQSNHLHTNQPNQFFSEQSNTKTQRRNSISDRKTPTEERKIVTRHSFSSKTCSSTELQSMKKIENENNLINNNSNENNSNENIQIKSSSKCQSPLLDESIFKNYQKNRKELVDNIDDDMDFDSFSFSEDSDLSLEDIPIHDITTNYRINKELDEMILYLTMKKEKLLNEIEELEHIEQC